MPDWTSLLTEEERIIEKSARLDTVSVMYKADDVMPLLRSLVALRALVAEKDKALAVIEDMTTDYVATDKAAGHVARAANAALALTEADMLKELEVK